MRDKQALSGTLARSDQTHNDNASRPSTCGRKQTCTWATLQSPTLTHATWCAGSLAVSKNRAPLGLQRSSSLRASASSSTISPGSRVLMLNSRFPASHDGHFDRCTTRRRRVRGSLPCTHLHTEPQVYSRLSFRWPCALNWCARSPFIPQHSLPQAENGCLGSTFDQCLPLCRLITNRSNPIAAISSRLDQGVATTFCLRLFFHAAACPSPVCSKAKSGSVLHLTSLAKKRSRRIDHKHIDRVTFGRQKDLATHRTPLKTGTANVGGTPQGAHASRWSTKAWPCNSRKKTASYPQTCRAVRALSSSRRLALRQDRPSQPPRSARGHSDSALRIVEVQATTEDSLMKGRRNCTDVLHSSLRITVPSVRRRIVQAAVVVNRHPLREVRPQQAQWKSRQELEGRPQAPHLPCDHALAGESFASAR